MQKIKQYKLDSFFSKVLWESIIDMERFEFKQGTCLTKGTERRGVKVVPGGLNDDMTMTMSGMFGWLPCFWWCHFFVKGGQRSQSYDIYHGKEHTCKFFRCVVLGCFAHCFWLSACTFCWLPLCTAGRLFKWNKLQNDIQIPSQKKRIIQIEHAKTQNEHGT